MAIPTNRLLMEFERLLREANRAAINPILDELTLEQLKPMAELVARARATYLKHLHDLASQYAGTDNLPTDDEMQALAQLRSRFLDLVEGSKSFETAIQRGYLDVKDR
ncbi:hypothetical protein L1F30_03980 [Simiduia sp. 21SJ11W-1]|uniref:hypothetical protein n=1 Tax=Simiduia sp. 21SJ11W-1 TaxID=2909669 RepID=UPI00209CFA6D|nr:hypothetical protein [Simiduia sp. 21SJ11W-1]UTA48706.1 hypothetical protein L1F30_03980 [Simiduia sp. 21SJ11W-1]